MIFFSCFLLWNKIFWAVSFSFSGMSHGGYLYLISKWHSFWTLRHSYCTPTSPPPGPSPRWIDEGPQWPAAAGALAQPGFTSSSDFCSVCAMLNPKLKKPSLSCVWDRVKEKPKALRNQSTWMMMSNTTVKWGLPLILFSLSLSKEHLPPCDAFFPWARSSQLLPQPLVTVSSKKSSDVLGPG